MERKSFIVIVPRVGNRKFRVFGFNSSNAELHFLFSVGDAVPDNLRKGNTDVRFKHDDIAFGRVNVELDTRQDMTETDDVVELSEAVR